MTNPDNKWTDDVIDPPDVTERSLVANVLMITDYTEFLDNKNMAEIWSQPASCADIYLDKTLTIADRRWLHSCFKARAAYHYITSDVCKEWLATALSKIPDGERE